MKFGVLRGQMPQYRHHFRVDGNAVLWWLWHGPFLPPITGFAQKTAFSHDDVHLIRAALPRPRYDRNVSASAGSCADIVNLLVTAACSLAAAIKNFSHDLKELLVEFRHSGTQYLDDDRPVRL